MFPTNPVTVQQNAASTQGSPQVTTVAYGELTQEEKARFERLVKVNPLIVVGKLQAGEPTGGANSHCLN